MMSKRNRSQLTLTYNDGTANICKENRINEEGDYPSFSYVQKHNLRYAQRTVGIKRFYTAQQANVKVDILIRTPRKDDVSTQDVVRLTGRGQNKQWYRIRQVQLLEGFADAMDISLERLDQEFQIEGEGDDGCKI